MDSLPDLTNPIGPDLFFVSTISSISADNLSAISSAIFLVLPDLE